MAVFLRSLVLTKIIPFFVFHILGYQGAGYDTDDNDDGMGDPYWMYNIRKHGKLLQLCPTSYLT